MMVLNLHWKADFVDGSSLNQYDTEGQGAKRPFAEVLKRQHELVDLHLLDQGYRYTAHVAQGYLSVGGKRVPYPLMGPMPPEAFFHQLRFDPVYFIRRKAVIDGSKAVSTFFLGVKTMFGDKVYKSALTINPLGGSFQILNSF